MNAQQLKNSILQLAVQGKLVPQNPNDEPASELLKRIKIEKDKLIKEKKIKTEKNPSEIFRGSDNLPYEKIGNETRCIADEVPFEIPDSWEWVRLVNVSIIQEGAGIRSYQYKDSGTQILTVTNILENGIDLEKSKKYISEEEYLEKYTHLTPQIGDIVTACSGGSWGKTAIFDKQDTMLLNTSTLRLRFFNDSANNMYLYYITKSDFFKSQLRAQLSGMQPNFGYAHYSKIFIPIPPIEEQKRIVDKFEQLIPFIEQYNKAETKNNELNLSFPDKLKKSILQDAVQGKLIPQDPNDEPASVLIERIREEKQKLIKEGKIKKDKNESYIFRRDNSHYEKFGDKEVCIDEEIPFDIPENWVWTRLGNILIKLTDGTHSTPKYLQEGIPFLSVKDMSSGVIDFSDTKFISEFEHRELYKRCNPEVGDLLLTKVGTTGIPVIVDTDKEFSLFVSVALLKFNHNFIFNKYLKYLILSPLVQNQAKENTKGVGNKNWVMRDIAHTLIPIPPFLEQNKIVKKIENIIPNLNKLS